MFLNLLSDAKFVKCQNGAVAGTSTLTATTVDMAGYDSICCVVDFGTITDGSVLTLKAQDGTDSGGSGAADISGATTGAFTGATSSNGQMVLDVQKPGQRYVTFVLTRATQNAVVNSFTAILYNAHSKPTTQPTTVLKSAVVLAAA